MQAAPKSGRRVESRFSGGFPWAERRKADSQKTHADESDLEGVAAQLLFESERTRESASLHAAGVARALLGSYDESVKGLEQVCQLTPHRASAWNDLAAARYALAAATNDPQRLPAALSTVDRALQLSPSSPEALFNRALILTRLGIRNEAMEGWRSVKQVERDPAWANEADRYLTRLRQDVIPPVMPRLQAALKSTDDRELTRLVRVYPQDTRIFAETELLPSWAENVHAGAIDEAKHRFEELQRVATLLAGVNGDRLMSDVVQNIAKAPAETRRRFADAYLAYRQARLHYNEHREGSAEEIQAAAQMFGRAGNPMEHVARYYAANALFASNRVEESRGQLETLFAILDPNRYPSLVAGAEKQLALYYGFRGMWTASLGHVHRSRTRFAAHGERDNAAFAEAVTGEAYDRIGDFGRGWRHRVAALDILSRTPPNSRSLPVLIGAVHAEIMRGDYESALSLIRIARKEAAQVRKRPDLQAETILREAHVLLIARTADETLRSLAEAKRAGAAIENKGAREWVEAEVAVVEAAIVRSSDPRRAIELVTPAIAFFQSRGLGILLPAAYLERGRAQLARGARNDARADFEHGLRWIEQQRANVAVDIRTSLFDTVPELTGELIALLLADGNDSAAFEVVERARARTLIEALGIADAPSGAGIDAVMAALPANAVLVEYALLPNGLAAFCVTPKGLLVHRIDAKPEELRRAIAELRTLIQEREPIADVQRVASQLYAVLLLPLETTIGGAEILYLAPDRFLNATPFAALYDAKDRKYLIQQKQLIVTPSAAFLTRRSQLRRAMRPALVIADPTGATGGTRLDAARQGARDIAALYAAREPLIGPDATIERFIAAAPNSALIHYAGHAHSDDTAGGFLPLAPSRGSDGRLDATAISRLPLHHTNLVILSACATMRGNASRIEGMPSLSRAFLNAGVPAVLGMLWEVDDRLTARLLWQFHQLLHEGTPPSKALREAQIRMITSSGEELPHPASWAAAEILGVD